MCLAVPGKVVSVADQGGSRMARVQFGGITRVISLDLVPEAAEGDFVLAHVGYAISRIDQEEAERTYHVLREMGEMEEFEAQESSAGSPDEIR